MHVMVHRENQDSIFLANAYQLSFVSWYQRSFLKEGLVFGARTTCNRSKPREMVVVDLPKAQAKCYVFIREDRLGGVVMTDEQYPERVAFSVLQLMLKQFESRFDLKSQLARKADAELKFEELNSILAKYQNPTQADKLQKLKTTLKGLEETCHKNLQDLMKRGEDIEELMKKSNDMSKISTQFYMKSKELNKKCCSLI